MHNIQIMHNNKIFLTLYNVNISYENAFPYWLFLFALFGSSSIYFCVYSLFESALPKIVKT